MRYLNFRNSLKKNNWLISLLVLLVFYPIYPCFGNNFTFVKITVEEGLSNNLVNTIYKDSLGFMWFGTLDGLDRYDGEEIKSFSSKFRIPIENVYAIIEDYDKKLWVGTGNGLFYFDRTSGYFEKVEIDNKNIAVKTLAISPDNRIFAGTDSGLYIIDPGEDQAKYILPGSVSNKGIKDITGGFFDNHGNFWMSTLSGLAKYSVKNDECIIYQFDKGPQSVYNSFTSICNIGNIIYLGTKNKGIVEFDLVTKLFSPGISLNNNIILTLSSDNKELLFVGTNGGGLKIVNVKTKQVETIENIENDPGSISSNSIYSFYLDENNRYWIGTYSGGVNYSVNTEEKFKLHQLIVDHPEINKSIRSFYFDPAGNYYLGTRNGFVEIDKKGKVRFFKSGSDNKTGLRSNIILSVFPYMNDILIGTYGGGISRLSSTTHQIDTFFIGERFFQGNAYRFKTDKDNNLWIATFEGIYKYLAKTKQLINYNKINCGLTSNEVFEINFDSKNRLWVGTMEGLNVFQVSGENLEKIPLSLKDDINTKINYIYEDLATNIWVCTERGGLLMFDHSLKSYKIYKKEDGLPDNSVCAIIESNLGTYWISTLKGFCKFKLKQEQFINYTLSDGLPGLVFTPTTLHILENGIIWAGNEKGLVYFSPVTLNDLVPLAKIQLTKFYLFGKEEEPGKESVLTKPIEFTKEILLDENQNSIGFKFIALNFINPDDNDYLFKLEGYDKEWRSNKTNRNTVFYKNLMPGQYTFRVRNANDPDENSRNNASVIIIIKKSLFANVLLIALFISCILGIIFRKRIIAFVKSLMNRDERPEKYKGSKLSDSQSIIIIEKIENYMIDKKPYLNAEMKLADLAKEVNYTVHDISQVLNKADNQGFANYVNKFRVEEVKKRLANKDYEKFTLYAIAQQCGFNSKTSFYRVFKNYTTKTPSDYLKMLKKE